MFPTRKPNEWHAECLKKAPAKRKKRFAGTKRLARGASDDFDRTVTLPLLPGRPLCRWHVKGPYFISFPKILEEVKFPEGKAALCGVGTWAFLERRSRSRFFTLGGIPLVPAAPVTVHGPRCQGISGRGVGVNRFPTLDQ